MGKGRTKIRLQNELLDPEFIGTPSHSQDIRKTFRAVRKRQIREQELRFRREHVMKKKLGIR